VLGPECGYGLNERGQMAGLPIALTKVEFEQRFSDCAQIFSTGDIFSEPLPRDRAKLQNEIMNRVAELVNREISRTIDLVYDDTL
jgi:hypothetical protein